MRNYPVIWELDGIILSHSKDFLCTHAVLLNNDSPSLVSSQNLSGSADLWPVANPDPVRSQGYSSAFSSLPRLLQTPQAQRLERDVADFTLAPQVTWKFDLQGNFLERKDRKVARNNPGFLLEKMST